MVESPNKKEDGTIIEFLCGSHSFEGIWYGFATVDKPAFWWRSHLIEYIQSQDSKLSEKGAEIERLTELLKQTKEAPILFGKWLQHLDNGTEHWNPFTKEATESIGFSPRDCFMDEIMTVEDLFKNFELERNKE